MSYILDALKRADAERERGIVPGLYARQLAASSAKAAPNARRPLWLALLAALALGGLAGGLWLWRSPAPATDPAKPAPASATMTAAPTAPTAPIAPIATPAAEIAAMPQATAAAPTGSAPALAPTASAHAAPPNPLPVPAPLPTVRASASPAPVVTLPLLAELSEDIRRQIPALSVTGAVYSESPGQRLLLVNNQVLSQGAQAAPEVTIEEIGTKSSILNFRGTRFRLAH